MLFVFRKLVSPLVQAKKSSFIAQYLTDFCQSKFLIFGLEMLKFRHQSIYNLTKKIWKI